MDGVRRDPVNVSRVIRSLARNVATLVSARTIAADAGGPDGPLDDDTVRDYLAALQRLMIYEEQPAWSPHLRSRSILRKSPTRHFVDPSLAVAASLLKFRDRVDASKSKVPGTLGSYPLVRWDPELGAQLFVLWFQIKASIHTGRSFQ